MAQVSEVPLQVHLTTAFDCCRFFLEILFSEVPGHPHLWGLQFCLSPCDHAFFVIIMGSCHSYCRCWGGPSSSPLPVGTHPSTTNGVGCWQLTAALHQRIALGTQGGTHTQIPLPGGPQPKGHQRTTLCCSMLSVPSVLWIRLGWTSSEATCMLNSFSFPVLSHSLPNLRFLLGRPVSDSAPGNQMKTVGARHGPGRPLRLGCWRRIIDQVAVRTHHW